MTIDNFDKIWCLHCVEHKQRYDMSQKEFAKAGLLDKVEYRMTSLQPSNLINASSLKLRNENEYHCTREHYTMCRIAYELGYEHILVFEDDIKFINKEYFYRFMNAIPDNFDILRLCGTTEHTYNDGPDLFRKGMLWTPLSRSLWGTVGYALSRNGMKYYTDYVERQYCVADMPLFDIAKINRCGLKCYISTLPVICTYDFPSSIQKTSIITNRYYDNVDMKLYE